MRTASEIVKGVEVIKGHTAAIARIDTDLGNKITALENEGRDPEWVKKETKKLREEASKTANAELVKLNELHEVLVQEREWWSDTPFLLSTLRVEDKAGVIADTKGMSTSLLATHIKHAIQTGELGKLYLLSNEMNQREVKPDNWQGVDFSKISFPIQKEALTALSAAKAAFDEGVITLRKINGTASAESLSIARLTSGHANEGK